MTNSKGLLTLLAAAPLLLTACATPENDKGASETEMAQATLPEWRAMWNFSDPAGTELLFRAAIGAGEAAGDSEYVLAVMTQLARTQGLQRKFDEAHGTLDFVEGRLAEASTEMKLRYLLERGRVLNSSGKPGPAALYFKDAWTLGLETELDNLTADAGHMLAIVTVGKEALAWADVTMTFCESSEDPRCKGWLGPLYNNTGWTHFDAGDFDSALELWVKSLAFREKEGNPETIFISRWTIARCYRALGRTEDALAQQEWLRADQEAANAPRDGYVSEEIAECMLALGRTEDSKPWFAKAFAELGSDAWLQANEPGRLTRLKQLGE